MNWKHFLRGLGAGIIFTAIIMLVAYMTSGSYRISDEEIIERAEKLGMVMEEKSIVAENPETETDAELKAEASETSMESTNTEEAASETATTGATTTEVTTTEVTTTGATTTEATTTEKVTTEKSTTEKATTEKATTEKSTTEKATTEKKTTEKKTTEKSTTEVNTQYVTAEITVNSGMGSEEIAKLVQDAGIIDDYKDFDNYLNQNGYSQKLSVNTFKLNSGMSYEELAKELTKGDR